MPLELLLPIVVIGITLIVLMTHLFGFSKKFDISSDAIARARWSREWEADKIGDVVLCENGTAALLDTDQGAGVLWAFGADTTTARLDHVDVARTKDGLKLKLHNFTAPVLHLTLSPTEADLWQQKIEGLSK